MLLVSALSNPGPTIRSDYDDNYTCPTPSLFRSSSDVTSTFSTKRSWGSWEATVDLGTRDADDDFQSAGYKFVVPCSYRVDRLGHDYDLLDENDEVVASVIADTFTYGWSLEVYDCGANLLASVEQQSLTRVGLELEIRDNTGNLAATTDYELGPINGDQLTVHGVGDQQGSILSTISHDTFQIGGQEWNIVMSAADGADSAGPGGDERVIAAIAAYMTWKDMDEGKGSFSGVCTYFVVTLEVGIVLGVVATCTACASWWKRPTARSRERKANATGNGVIKNVTNPLRMSDEVAFRMSDLGRPLSNDLEEPDASVPGEDNKSLASETLATTASELPPGWESRSHPSGNVQYVNTTTGEKSWIKPDAVTDRMMRQTTAGGRTLFEEQVARAELKAMRLL